MIVHTSEKGLFIKHKNQISRVSLVCTDIVIIILIASVDCGSLIPNPYEAINLDHGILLKRE